MEQQFRPAQSPTRCPQSLNMLSTNLVQIILFLIANHPEASVDSRLPENWIQLSKTTSGYVVYSPCDGQTPSITIKKHSIVVHWNLDSGSFKFKTFEQLQDSTYLIQSKDGEVRVRIKWMDKEKKRALWQISLGNVFSDKWMMCPIEEKSEFGKIDNPCPTEKVPEKVFLPIDEE